MTLITEVYSHYKIFPGLQMHQLRVAAVGKTLCDAVSAAVNTNDVVTALLLHDMGNIIKSDLSKFPAFLEPEGLEYWQGVQNEFFERYGRDEHAATLQIAKELGVSDDVYFLLGNMGFREACHIRDHGMLGQKICEYSDLRVSPNGVVSLQQRVDDLMRRYANTPRATLMAEEIEDRKNALLDIEKELFVDLSLRPEDINDARIADTIVALKGFELPFEK